jgi:hypothetical protein
MGGGNNHPHSISYMVGNNLAHSTRKIDMEQNTRMVGNYNCDKLFALLQKNSLPAYRLALGSDSARRLLAERQG